ncbi:putative acetolactate synthase large subunit domain protein [Mycobacterium xenopi 4042]|uniref:Putative acetolactate synthase large subunit domain protein n=1 Tax=Mycobacterium xenopi 4042 TaxID=1299334 RepID=X7YL27_MYCXE|nr:putative acetolactate synthase large subunit domain protein [Mycobacterium xenopi 4042]
MTREQLYYGDRYSYNRFAPSRLGAGLAAMFPGCRQSTSTTPADWLPRCALRSTSTARRW